MNTPFLSHADETMNLDIQEAMQTISERVILLAAEDPDFRDHLRLLAGKLSQSSSSSQAGSSDSHISLAQVDANGSQGPVSQAGTELQDIEARCELKVEGCQWAAERVRLREEGADHRIDIAPHDRYILDKARQSHCDLWMNRPDSPVPNDLSLLEVVGGCFASVSKAVAVARLVTTDLPSNRYLLAESLQLVAESQSSLRSSIQQINGPTDADQTAAFRWVLEAAKENDLFIERFLHIDDPADPQRWPDLLARIQSLRERVDDERILEHRRRKLLRKLRHQLAVASDTDSVLRVGHWKQIAQTVHDIVETGVPPSNREIRDLVKPHINGALVFDDSPKGYELVLREIKRSRDGGNVDEVAECEIAATPEVTTAAQLLKEKRLVLIGGDCRAARKEALERAFGLKELVWVETKPGQSVNSFVPFVARPDVAAVLLAIRWSSHGFVEVRQICDRYDKPLVWLPGGYGVNQVANLIMAQCSERLRSQCQKTLSTEIST